MSAKHFLIIIIIIGIAMILAAGCTQPAVLQEKGSGNPCRDNDRSGRAAHRL